MVKVKRTDAADPDFVFLVKLLDAFLAEIDGEDHAFYAQFNKVASLPCAVVAYWEGLPVGCGAFKPFDADSVEVKRMYVLPEKRGLGIGAAVLQELEAWAAGLGFARCVLETGKRQPEAIALYSKSSYVPIPNFGQYARVENSVCFEKKLNGSGYPTTVI